MENAMWRVTMGMLAGLLLAGSVAAAETAAEMPQQAAQPKCLTAEVNPVTGHVLCIEPLGAAVEPLAPEAMAPCKPEDARGQWSYAPNCTPTPEM
jgi:hypothetical protein